MSSPCRQIIPKRFKLPRAASTCRSPIRNPLRFRSRLLGLCVCQSCFASPGRHSQWHRRLLGPEHNADAKNQHWTTGPDEPLRNKVESDGQSQGWDPLEDADIAAASGLQRECRALSPFGRFHLPEAANFSVENFEQGKAENKAGSTRVDRVRRDRFEAHLQKLLGLEVNPDVPSSV